MEKQLDSTRDFIILMISLFGFVGLISLAILFSIKIKQLGILGSPLIIVGIISILLKKSYSVYYHRVRVYSEKDAQRMGLYYIMGGVAFSVVLFILQVRNS